MESNSHGNLDEQISQPMQCKPLSEPEVRVLCDKSKEILMEESNVQVLQNEEEEEEVASSSEEEEAELEVALQLEAIQLFRKRLRQLDAQAGLMFEAIKSSNH